MTAPALPRVSDADMAATLTEVLAKQVQHHHNPPGLDGAYLNGWVRMATGRWQITAAGRTELARLTGACCHICGGPSLDPECTKCAVGEEVAWKRRQDI